MSIMLSKLRDHNSAGTYWGTSYQACNNNHPLAFIRNTDDRLCDECGKHIGELTFCCSSCDFDMCVECATQSTRYPVAVTPPLTFTEIAKTHHGILLHKSLYLECGRIMAQRMMELGRPLTRNVHPYLPNDTVTYLYGEEHRPMMRDVVYTVLESRGLSLGWDD